MTGWAGFSAKRRNTSASVASTSRPRSRHSRTTERTSGEVRLGPGTLYNAIKKMLEQKLIAEERSRPAPEEDDPRRRYYRITRIGEAALAAETSKLDRLLRAARAKAALP